MTPDTEQRDADAAWLAGVCDGTDPNRPAVSQPYTVTLGDAEWTVATNGHRLVALEGGRGFPPFPVESLKYVLKALETPTVIARTVNLAALRSWCGAGLPPLPDCATCLNTGELECSECKGDGGEECECPDCGTEHTRRCAACNDDGSVACPHCSRGIATPDYGRIFGRLFNRTVLRFPLQHLTGDVATWREPESASAAHRLDGPGWRLIVMPMRDADSPRRIATSYDETTTEKAAGSLS